jgi:hypothetical protein
MDQKYVNYSAFFVAGIWLLDTVTYLHYTYRMGVSTISKTVRHVCQNIWALLYEEFMPKQSTSRWEVMASGFDRKANLPHCIGAVDGKHIRIIKPEHSGSMYFNYKDYFSIVLLSVADSEYRFTFVDIGAYGKDYDSTIFKETSFWKLLENDSLNIPSSKTLNGTVQPNVPYVILGGEAFALRNNLLRPFSGTHLDMKKRVFNYRLSRARRYAECAFDILTNQWRIFHRPINVSPDFAVDIVKACTVLHNIVREKNGYNFEDILTTTGLDNLPNGQIVSGGLATNRIWDASAEYFVSDVGSLSWQLTRI